MPFFSLSAAPISIATAEVRVFSQGEPELRLDTSSIQFQSALSTENTGDLIWHVDIAYGLKEVTVLAFLDLDIDRDENTFFNEFGALVSLTLPPFTPSNALPPTSWEIDEPGYLFGDIVHNISEGRLDNSNAIPMSSPDDVSMALGFYLGDLIQGDVAKVVIRVDTLPIGGLRQADNDSGRELYVNGFVLVDNPGDPSSTVPEPNAAALVAVGVALFAGRKISSGRS